MTATEDTRKTIGRQISCWFKNQGYSFEQAAKMMGIAKQTLYNQTHGAVIGAQSRDKYFLTFGFDPEYLRTGKGTLIKTPSGYQKIKEENKQLKAIIKAQNYTITQLRKEIKILQENKK